MRPTANVFISQQEAILQDSTRSLKLQLFGDDVDTVQVGKTYIFNNGLKWQEKQGIRVARKIWYLNTPKSGDFNITATEPIQNRFQLLKTFVILRKM